MNKVPLVKLEPMPDVRARVGTQFIGGPVVTRFEKRWAVRTGAVEAVGCGNGTDALTLALYAAAGQRRGPGRKKVIIPAMSFVATLEAVLNAGLDPVLVDTDAWGNMSMRALEEALKEHGDSVVAVVPVHLYGRVADSRRAADLAKPHGAIVVEDACQAHGARYPDGAPVGSRFMAAWSFMPAKILGACGDAGAVTFPRGFEYQRMVRRHANHGRTTHNTHAYPGANSRLDAIQAAVLSRRLPYLGEYVDERAARACGYAEALGDLVRVQPNDRGRVWSYYVVRAESRAERDTLKAHLHNRGISTGRHYPYTLANAFEFCHIDGRYPMAEQLANTGITLPLWPTMPFRVQDRVVQAVREFYEAGA